MKARNGRTVRAQLIKEKAREEILRGDIELLRAGTTFPTAIQTAEQASLPRRVIFKHLPISTNFGLRQWPGSK